MMLKILEAVFQGQKHLLNTRGEYKFPISTKCVTLFLAFFQRWNAYRVWESTFWRKVEGARRRNYLKLSYVSGWTNGLKWIFCWKSSFWCPFWGSVETHRAPWETIINTSIVLKTWKLKQFSALVPLHFNHRFDYWCFFPFKIGNFKNSLEYVDKPMYTRPRIFTLQGMIFSFWSVLYSPLHKRGRGTGQTELQ